MKFGRNNRFSSFLLCIYFFACEFWSFVQTNELYSGVEISFGLAFQIDFGWKGNFSVVFPRGGEELAIGLDEWRGKWSGEVNESIQCSQ
jgi:hypothetical protein